MAHYCVSDPKHPNCYEWIFCEEYPSFPCSLSNMTRDHMFDCIEALEAGQLRVARVNASPPDDRALLDLKRIDNIASLGINALIAVVQNRLLRLLGEQNFSSYWLVAGITRGRRDHGPERVGGRYPRGPQRNF